MESDVMQLPPPDLSEARLRRLPIFPLPNTVLIPGGYLPLHVFEPRYRALVADCLADDRVMAVPLLVPEGELGSGPDPKGRPRVYRISGVGYIDAIQPLDDGCSNIVLKGMTRVRIVEELVTEHPYRLVQAETLDDRQDQREEQRLSARVLRQLARQLLTRLPDELGQQMIATMAEAQDPGGLADLVGASVLLDPGQRQAFLEERSVARRLGVTTQVVAGLLAKISDASGENVAN
jgi:Lon protease-like protein